MNKEYKPHAKEAGGCLIERWSMLSLFHIGLHPGGCFTEYFRILHYAVGYTIQAMITLCTLD